MGFEAEGNIFSKSIMYLISESPEKHFINGFWLKTNQYKLKLSMSFIDVRTMVQVVESLV